MANCTNCAAPLPAASIRCEYCGSRNDVDLRGVHYYTSHAPDSKRTCPRCNTPLRTIELRLNGSFLIERCDTCLGLFFDPGELETLLDASVAQVYDIDHARLATLSSSRRSDDYGVSYIKCPVCSTMMNRVNLGARSGVVADRCRAHGVWLDGGELRQLLEWMKAGGKLLDQRRKEERQKEEAARERTLRQSLDQRGVSGESSDFGPAEEIPGDDLDLLEIIVDAIRYFVKR